MGLWNTVTNKAWDESKIVYAMDQMMTAGAKAPNGCTGGYCFGLAAVWARRKWRLTEYEYDRGAYEFSGTDWMAVKVQKAYDTELAVATSTWAPITRALAKADMKLIYGKSQTSPTSVHGSGLFNVLQNGDKSAGTKGGDGIYIVGVNGTYGAHAFAIFNAGSRYWFLFDGNYGLVSMQGNGVFKEFLVWYIGAQGTKYSSKYGAEWLTACVVPTWLNA